MKEYKAMDGKNILIGRNAVTEALKSGRTIEKITVAKGSEGSIKKIVAQAKEKNIMVQFVEKSNLDRVAEGANHQGVLAHVSEFVYSEIDDILKEAKNKGEDPFIIILDGLEDPHNLGAIMRSAECAGVHGIIIPKRRSVSVTDTVAKASAGAVEYMKVAKVTNIAQAISKIQDMGIWVYACDMDGEIYDKTNLSGAIAVVIGSEGKGISKLVRDKCDFVVSIPMCGNITSLNASNAAAVLMYEVRRQRNVKV